VVFHFVDLTGYLPVKSAHRSMPSMEQSVAKASTSTLPVSSRRSFSDLFANDRLRSRARALSTKGAIFALLCVQVNALRDVNGGVLVKIPAEPLDFSRQRNEQSAVEMHCGSWATRLPTGHLAMNLFKAVQGSAPL
jgi:hypothetical protein